MVFLFLAISRVVLPLLLVMSLLLPNYLPGQDILKKRITINQQEVALSVILDSISIQSGARFAYNKRKVNLEGMASLQVVNQELGLSLQELLDNTFIDFSVTGQQISLFSKALPVFTISGYTRDANSGEALIGANIYEILGLRGVSSNEYGFFSLSLTSGRYICRTSFVGYEDRIDTLFLDQDLEIDINLQAGNSLQEVTVISSTQANNEYQRSIGHTSGSIIQTEGVGVNASLIGEDDMMKVAQLLPGIISGLERSSNFHVHGGSPDQNLILLDGVPLYNVSHLFGFISIFNHKALNSSTIYQSGFPARFSGRLSSIIDVRMKDGNNQSFHGGLDLGFLAGSAYLEGPLKKGKGSFLISGRRTWLDLIAASAQIGNKEVKTNYNFHDINAKLNWHLSPKDRLFFSLYSGKDRFLDKRTVTDQFFDNVSGSTTLRNGLNWGNRAIAFRWNRILTPKLFSNASIYFGNFNYGLESFISTKSLTPTDTVSTVTSDIVARSSIKDYGVRIDLDFLPNYQHHFRLGLGYALHDFIPGFLEGFFENNGQRSSIGEGALPVVSHEWFAYLEDEIKLNKRFTLHPGFHFTWIKTNNKSFGLPQFRFKLNCELRPRHHLSFSYSGMAQFVHLLTNIGIGLPTDFWVPSTQKVKPEFAHQLAATYELPMGDMGIAKASFFYKTMRNLIEFQNGASLLNSTSNWESRIEIGKGWSYGATLLLGKTIGKTNLRLAYSLIWSKRQFDNLNQGAPFPYKYDRWHNLNISLKHEWQGKKNKRKDIGLLWVLSSGALTTTPSEWYLSSSGDFIAHYPYRNNFRLPVYHRLDFAKSSSKKNEKRPYPNLEMGSL